MRWAFEAAHLGTGFHGFQRQPDVLTVEGELLKALGAARVMEDADDARFQGASRTDRGVSALGNVIALNTSWDPREVIAVVNPRLRGIWLHACDGPGPDFNPREARERWYRYYYPRALDCGRLAEGGRILLGKHDFRASVKGGGHRCEIRSLNCTREGAWTVLDVRGDRFLWNMVRRIAGALEAYSEVMLMKKDLTGALEEKPIPRPPSPAEGLVLMDVDYAFSFRSFLRLFRYSLREREFHTRLEATLLANLWRAGSAQDSYPTGARPKL